MENTNKFSSVLKGTALFGGVQIVTIFVNLVRGKFIALLLGPVGVGIMAIFTNAVNLIQQSTALGINLSGVRDISSAKNSNPKVLSKIILVFRKLSVATAVVGAIATCVLSGFLSELSFKTTAYMTSFMFLSILVFFATLTNSEVAIMQGVRSLRQLAFSSLIGAVTGLLISVPFYFFWGQNGIVPAMVIPSIITFIVHRYHTRKLNLIPVKVGRSELVALSKGMIALGLSSMLTGSLGNLTNYSFNNFITNWGAIRDLGIYQGASSITNQYVAVLFSAMAADYFPRLSAVADDIGKVNDVVNTQLNVLILIVSPLLVLMLITAPILIRILLSSEFTDCIPLIKWMAFGLFFKVLSYPLGYMSFAKGDKKLFLFLEGFIVNLFVLSINIAMYFSFGVRGLGASFLLIYILYLSVIFSIVRNRYGYKVDKGLYKIVAISFISLFIVFTYSEFRATYDFYIVSVCILLMLSYRNLKELEKRTGRPILTFLKNSSNANK